MYGNRLQGLLTKKRIFGLAAIVLFIVVIVVLLNLRVVSVNTNTTNSEIAIHAIDQGPSYPETTSSKTRFIRWGASFSVSARDGFQEARYTKQKSFSLIPFVNVELTIKPQVASSKVASTGDRCVLYTNIPEDTIIVSDCITNTTTNVRTIKNGVRETGILPGVALVQSSPSQQGFYFVATSNEDSNKFDINLYNPGTNTVEKILESQTSQPVLLTNESTGYFGGAVVGDKFYSQQDLVRSNKKSVQIAYNKNGDSVERLYGLNNDGLYVYSAIRITQPEEDSDTFTDQTIQLFNTATGEQLYSKKASTKAKVVTLVTTSATASLRTEDPKEFAKTFGVEGELDSLITSLDTAGGVVSLNDSFYFVSSGAVWSISQSASSRNLNLVYTADEINVTDIKKVGSKILVSASSVKNGGAAQISNYQLDLTKEAPNAKRIESILPIMNWSDNLLYADIYKNVIAVNYQNNNPSIKETPETTFSKIGIRNLKDYRIRINDPSYFAVQNTNPTNSTKNNFNGSEDEGRDDLNPDLQ